MLLGLCWVLVRDNCDCRRTNDCVKYETEGDIIKRIINSWCFQFCILKKISRYYPLEAFGIMLRRTDESEASEQTGKHVHSVAHLSLWGSFSSTMKRPCCQLDAAWFFSVTKRLYHRCQMKAETSCSWWKQRSFFNLDTMNP